MACLGKGIFQGGPAVTHRLPPHLLGTVEVPQSHIVKGVKGRYIYVVGPAHRKLLRLAPLSSSDKLMGHQHIPEGGVHGHFLNCRG